MPKLFKIISQNKKSLFLVLGIGLFLSFLPLHNAQAADIWDAISKGIDIIAGGVTTGFAWPVLIPMFIFLIIGCIISWLLFTVSLLLLKLVTSGYLITLPFTSGGIVNDGWQATLSIANLGFVLVLVFIALSTILRLENYGMKKLLPKLILVIILINFSAVICGMVVDIANAVTRSFLNFNPETIFSNMFAPFQQEVEVFKQISQGQVLEGVLSEIGDNLSFSGLVERVTGSIVAIFFGIFASFIFGLYFILFLLRYVAIWILVILAPVAWFCWILPDFRSIYQAWEKYFIQWAFIGAIGGFFLKLGAIAMTSLRGGVGMISAPDVGGWQQPIVSSFGWFFESLNSIVLSAAVLIFLIIGFILTLKFSGGGTDMAMKWAQGALKNTGAWAGGGIRRLATPRVAPGMEKIGRSLEERGGKYKGIGKPVGSSMKFVGWGLQRGAANLKSSEMADLQEKQGKMAKKTIEEKDLELKRPGITGATLNDKIATFSSIIENGEIDDFKKLKIAQYEKAGKPRGEAKEMAEKDIDNMAADLGGKAMKIHTDTGKPFLKAFGHKYAGMTEKLDKETQERIGVTITPEDEAQRITNVIEKLAMKLKPADIPKVSESFLKHPRLMGGKETPDGPDLEGAIHKFWTGEQVGAAGRHFSLGFLVPFQKKVDTLGEDWYGVNNERLHRYLNNTAARSLGIGFRRAPVAGGGGPTPPGGGGPAPSGGPTPPGGGGPAPSGGPTPPGGGGPAPSGGPTPPGGGGPAPRGWARNPRNSPRGSAR